MKNNLKKIIIGILSAATLSSLATCSCSYANDRFETWYVNAESGLNCRKSPEIKDDNIICTYDDGTELQIIGIDKTGEWWEVWDGKTQGWCYSDYFRKEKENAAPTTENMTYIGTFKCTTYTPDPAENGGGNHTAKGDLLTDVVGYAIAADPNVIPYNTKVYIKDIGYRVVRDCGGAIKGNRIDVLAWGNDMSYLGGYSDHEVYIVN